MSKIRYVVWREGRPRFSPGAVVRWLGFVGKDLQHADGSWFTLAECRKFSAEIAGEIELRRRETQRLGRRPPATVPQQRVTNDSGYVYFLRSGERIKVGFSQNPWMRAASLLTGIPHGIDSMVMVPGSERDERNVHRLLEVYRQRGEWFDANSKVVEVMIRALTFGRIALEEKPGRAGLSHACDTPAKKSVARDTVCSNSEN